MATSSAKARKSAPGKASTDAIALLTNDHKEVKALFKQYDHLAGGVTAVKTKGRRWPSKSVRC